MNQSGRLKANTLTGAKRGKTPVTSWLRIESGGRSFLNQSRINVKQTTKQTRITVDTELEPLYSLC